jgi:Zn-dependent metalloprotease
MKNKALKNMALGFFGLVALNASAQKNTQLSGTETISYSKLTLLPNFIKFKPTNELAPEQFVNWVNNALRLPSNTYFKAYDVNKDQIGFTHTRYKQYVGNYPIDGTMLITHIKDGKIVSVNGDYYQQLQQSYTATITEQKALEYALNKVDAQSYMWQGANFKYNKPKESYYPKGELVIVHKRDANYDALNVRIAYKFNIYADKPLYRANVYIDAQSGEFLSQDMLIHTGDVVGNASTLYSGNKTMTSQDMGGGQFQLFETGRGNGITTQNLQNGTSGISVPFTNNSSNWNFGSDYDKVATDAHWGAEMTYDYLSGVHGRNSINNAGFALNSYVHHDVGYANAYWNGSEMTYGDGNGNYYYMTGLDVCGHEIGHGLNTFTAGLSGGGSGEPDALNEAFADMIGTSVEAFARPGQSDWLIGADITNNGAGFRDMSYPNSLGYPDTYHGTYWDNTGEPHYNATPAD